MVQLKLKLFYIPTQLEQSICLQDRYFPAILFQLLGNCLQSAVIAFVIIQQRSSKSIFTKIDPVPTLDRVSFWSIFDKNDCKLKKIFQWTPRSILSSILFFLFWLCWCTICTFNGEIVWCTSYRYCDCPKERFFRSIGSAEESSRLRLVALKSNRALKTFKRKVCTITLSFIFFSKPFTIQYVWSGLLVLLGISFNIYR